MKQNFKCFITFDILNCTLYLFLIYRIEILFFGGSSKIFIDVIFQQMFEKLIFNRFCKNLKKQK